MKKIFVTMIMALGLLGMVGCSTNGAYNKQFLDMNNHYDYAIVQWYDGEEIIPITAWRDYEYSDQIQIKSAIDGKLYLFHSSRIVLVAESGYSSPSSYEIP